MNAKLILPFLAFALFLVPASFVSANETCGATTCTGASVCCDFFVGTGPQCIADASQCPATNRVNPPGVQCGTRTCAPRQICCDSYTGSGPQCLSLTTCPDPTQQQASPTETRTPDAAANTSGSGLINPLRVNSLQELITAVLHGVVQIGSILLVLALVWVGFMFVSAQGAEEKIRDARNALVWTVAGGLLLLGAEAISLVIQNTVNTL